MTEELYLRHQKIYICDKSVKRIRRPLYTRNKILINLPTYQVLNFSSTIYIERILWDCSYDHHDQQSIFELLDMTKFEIELFHNLHPPPLRLPNSTDLHRKRSFFQIAITYEISLIYSVCVKLFHYDANIYPNFKTMTWPAYLYVCHEGPCSWNRKSFKKQSASDVCKQAKKLVFAKTHWILIQHNFFTPNTHDIPNRLRSPAVRDSLLKRKLMSWFRYVRKNKNFQLFYDRTYCKKIIAHIIFASNSSCSASSHSPRQIGELPDQRQIWMEAFYKSRGMYSSGHKAQVSKKKMHTARNQECSDFSRN